MSSDARDPLLRPFVEAGDDESASTELAALVEAHALPLARRIVGRKLGSFGSGARGCEAQDHEDVVAEAMTTLVERLQAERESESLAPIESFSSYVAAVVFSACAHHVRRRYPRRAALKSRLRYVFSSTPRLALWTTDDETACGLAAWRGQPIGDGGARDRLRDALRLDERPWIELAPAEMTRRATELITVVGAPVSLEALVEAVASGLKEPIEGADPSLLASSEPSHDVVLEHRSVFARVWQEVVALPLGQRMALLLNLRGANGAGLLWLLPVAGVATIRQIARLLEIPEPEFAAVWRELPLDDARIAERLGCTRQQVINLRMAARKRLGNRLQAVLGPGTARRRPAVNLAAVSDSLKSSA